MNSFQRLVRRVSGPVLRRRSYLIFKLLILLNYILRRMPSRVAFTVIVYVNALSLPGKSLLPRAFQPIVVLKLQRNSRHRFTSAATRIFLRSEVKSLFKIGAYREVEEVVTARGLHIVSPEITTLLVLALFELGEFEKARAVMDVVFSPTQLAQTPLNARFKGLLDIVAGDLAAAVRNLVQSGKVEGSFLQPHHNMAARYPSTYTPSPLDVLSGENGRIYDAANYLGQRVTHVGRGDSGARIYSAALEAQDRLAQALPTPSSALATLLEELALPYDDVCILPEEWFSQVGHLGMLDILFRMRELGWWSGRAIMLAQPKLIANQAFLRLYQQNGDILVAGANVAPQVASELASLQRWKGMSFNAFALPNGDVVPWQDAGALAMRQWEGEGRGYPIRDEFDRQFGSSEMLEESVAKIKKRWGMKPDDWYVCLHMRDAAHYGELQGMGQTHRNGSVQNYIAAIKYITDQGGWVIKLGGPRSLRLPKMPRVFDYARSKYCSDVMDLHLIRNARFFVGTTSGLTNVAVSFGVPCALVNCITTDAQLWSNRVRFALKRLRLLDGTLVNQHQLTTAPWRWRVFQAELVGRAGAVVEENASWEILETVKEVNALALGEPDGYLASFSDHYDRTIEKWRANLAFPHFYGDALPAVAVLVAHKDFLTSR